MDTFEELRRLLLTPEHEELRALRDRLEDKKKRALDVSGVLPEAAKLSVQRDHALSHVLEPMVAESIRDAIKTQPQLVIDAFAPIMGPLIRRSIAESLRGMMQSLNQTLEHAFSVQGLKWRFEAWRTGRSFASVVLLRSLIYRVEQVFLIHRETSLLLLHVADESAECHDSDMVASTLSAIQDFVRDSFRTGANSGLDEFRMGELSVWIERGPAAYLATVIRGNPPRDLRTTIEETVETIHLAGGAALANFKGDPSIFEPLRPKLESCLSTQFIEPSKEEPSLTKAWLALGGATAVAALAIFMAVRSERRWDAFIHRLNAEPGIAVTESRKRFISASHVEGLLDPLAADPVPLAREMGIDPQRVTFDWKGYCALDATSVQRRVEERFGVPAGTRVAVAQGVLRVSGPVPYEWIERVRREHGQVPGVASLAENEAQVTYDPARVLERFHAAFPPPPAVVTRVEGHTLHLSGKADEDWIGPVRAGATRLPGISALADRDLQVSFDPARVLQRFEGRFGLPETVSASVQNGVLNISGEASHEWLARVRRHATELPGITSIRERDLADRDQWEFQQAKAAIESAFVYFLLSSDKLAPDALTGLSWLPDAIRRCQSAAKRVGGAITLEIRGSADASGSELKNIELSERRAQAVRDFLVSSGLDAGILKPVARPSLPPVAAGPEAASGEAARRVAFHVISQQ